MSKTPLRRLFRYIALASLLLFLAGCEILQPSPQPLTLTQPINWVEHVRTLTLMNEWHLKGKIGIKQGSEGGSAYLDWIQSQDSFHITLSGPLGQGATIISGNKSGAKLENSDGSFIAETPEELLYLHSGWNIPISNLLYWIKGLPEPRRPHTAIFDSQGLISSLKQNGWALLFDRYQIALGEPVPHKIKISSGDLKVTLLVKQWVSTKEEER